MMVDTVPSGEESEPQQSQDTLNQDPSFLTEEAHIESRIVSLQKEITDLERQKEEERQEGVQSGRIRWFNQEIEDLRDEMRDLVSRGEEA